MANDSGAERSAKARITWVVTSGENSLEYARDETVEGTRLEITPAGGLVIWDESPEDGDVVVFAASPQHDWRIKVLPTIVKTAKSRRRRSKKEAAEEATADSES